MRGAQPFVQSDITNERSIRPGYVNGDANAEKPLVYDFSINGR